MLICPICYNHTFRYIHLDNEPKIAICTQCGEDFYNDHIMYQELKQTPYDEYIEDVGDEYRE